MPSPKPPIRLAILEADTLSPAINAQFAQPGYFGVFTSLFERATSPTPLDSILHLTKHTVVYNDITAYPPLDTVDAILITGSHHSAYENDPWITTLVEYTRQALESPRPIRVVGVCFGHQIVGRALGVPVERGSWEVSVTELRLSEKGKELFGKESLKVQQMHRDEVLGLPAGAELLAETDICANHAFLIPKKAITIQGHPEFTSGVMQDLLESRKAKGLFTPEIFESAMKRNVDEQDGVLVAQGFIKFLQDE